MNFKLSTRALPVALSLLGLCVAPAASAATNTGNMDVSANIDTTCSVSASPMAFGTVVPGVVKETTAVVTAICTFGTAYTLDLGDGLNHITTGGTSLDQYRRQMAIDTNRLPYVVSKFPTYTPEIAATAAGAAINNLLTTTVGNAVAQPVTIYGRIVGVESAAKAPGSYADTVTVTIGF